MELEEAIKILENHNQWRRNNDILNPMTMVNPKTLGIAIDTVVECGSKMNNERIIVKWWRALYFKFRYVYLSHVLGLWIPVTKILPLTNDEDYHKRHFWVKSKDKKTGKILIFVAHYWNDNWSNLDTWEDLHNEVTHFKEIKRPKP